MQYICTYKCMLGEMLLASNGKELTGLWFNNQKYFANNLENNTSTQELDVFKQTKKWLDIYFSGKMPNFTPPLCLQNASSFKKLVWDILLKIPYGETTTYGNIAKQIENQTHKRVSAQAVGGAVGHNPISIIVPCHRVIGSSLNLTGYAGGIDKKLSLLKLEHINTSNMLLPKKKK